MKTAFKLAYRNLIGAGLRTWLNVLVLSLSFVIIIWHKGMLDGWDQQARTDMINWEYGGGQYCQENYDPYDPFSLSESHAPIPEAFRSKVQNNKLLPVLITQGTLYPEGRVQSILIKGIKTNQDIVHIPSQHLDSGKDEIFAVIGRNMAKSNKLDSGDYVTLRWRDVNPTCYLNYTVI